ncbi:MAG: GSCFA domain-containing protein, partial [Flavobacteriaceae bacterium CG_4_8_14_3_um_filter_34_10]
DELRDYRFYTQDMVHPSPVAIDYIWQRFVETWISEEVLPTMKEIENIQ